MEPVVPAAAAAPQSLPAPATAPAAAPVGATGAGAADPLDAKLRAVLGSSTNRVTAASRQTVQGFLSGRDRTATGTQPAAATGGKLDVPLHETPKQGAAVEEGLFTVLVLELDYNTGKHRKLKRTVRRRSVKKKAAS